MRTGLFALLLLAWPALSAPGQPAKSDLARFVVPEGFTLEKGDGQVVLTRVDQQRGIYVRYALYDSRPSLGSAQKDFASEWRETVEANFRPAHAPAPTPSRTAAGIPFLEGSSEAKAGSGAVFCDLLVFQLRGRVASLMVVSPSRAAFETIRGDLSRFLQDLRFEGEAAGPAGPVGPAAPAAPRPAASEGARGGSLVSGAAPVGVWVGMKATGGLEMNAATGRLEMQAGTVKLRWRTFLSDGSSYEDLPTEGFLRLDPGAARKDPQNGPFWGAWTLSGSKVTARQPSGRVQEYHLDGEALAEDPKSTGSAKYRRARGVDGLRLEGTWSSWQGWQDSQASPKWTSAPVIRLTRDGRFADRGILMDSVTEPLTARNAGQHPGQGTYEIRAFTLVLRYQDGREVHRTFTPAMSKDAAADDSVVFIGRFPFYRLLRSAPAT